MAPEKNKVELLSPAKNAAIGIEAIRHGADAVYIGGPAFGARSAAGNSLEDIERLCSFAHRFRARILLTLNTILRDEEIEPARDLAWKAWEAGVDALIIQDMGLLKTDLPPIQLHASTQCDIRTPEKAKFLEDSGFSQIVPARELTLPEIRAIADVLDSARIECFVHGALCVSYSGLCYASEALKHRSANRGACAQICRLPYRAELPDGTVLEEHRYLLSLKDNDQAANLGELLDAGVRSFKIEGRLKDMDYVKNITAWYRKALDRELERRPELAHESVGEVRFSFEPNPAKTFSRGSTDYFLHGRHPGIASLDTPKSAGEPVGTVIRTTSRSILVRASAPLHNGDGLTYFSHSDLRGLLVNRVERIDGSRWEAFTRETPARLEGLVPGTPLSRNRDQEWEKKLEGKTAERRVPVTVEAWEEPGKLELRMTDPEGTAAQLTLALRGDPARNPEKATSQLRTALSKLGDTDYEASEARVHAPAPVFIPISELNSARRELVSRMNQAREKAFVRWERTPPRLVPFPLKKLDYRGNVFNSLARSFYEERGCEVTEPAFESGEKTEEVELMRCRHCIRYTLGLCPKEAAKRGEKVKPLPITLVSGPIRLTARFHCGPCEMSVWGARQKT